MATYFYGNIWYSFIGLVVAIILGFWLYMETKFKHKVIIKEVAGNRFVVKTLRAREYTDSDKSMWWKISGEKNKEKRLLPIPPDEVVEMTTKGKKIAQCYRFESGEIVWIKDDNKIKEPPIIKSYPEDIQAKIDAEEDYKKKKEIMDEYQKGFLDEWKRENKIVTPFQPVTTNDRLGYFYNIKKAESRKGFDWKEKIIPIAALASLTIIVLGGFIMWGEIAAPALQADEIVAGMQANQLEQTKIQADMRNNQQRIMSALNIPITNQTR